MSTYQTCLLKTRLIHQFGNALTFHRPQQRNVFEYVFSSKVPRGPIVEFEKCAKALRTLDNFKETPASMDIDAESPEFEESPGPTLFRAALCLRSNVMDGATSIPFLSKPTDISDQAASAQVPTPPFNFLAWLLLGDNASQGLSLHEKVELASESDRCHVLSVAQDIIHCVIRGRIKTAKHVGLPLAMKHISGSAKVVSLLNRFGHGLSATQMQEVEARMAQQLIAQRSSSTEKDVFVPSNIQPGTPFVQVCWVNNDLLEETLTGIGTTHCTNGIAIQRQVQLAMPQTQSVPMQPTSKGSTVVDCYPA